MSAFRRSESAVTPKLYGLDLPDVVRQRIYYGSVAGDARGCHRPAGHGHGFHGCHGSPRSAPDRNGGLPAAAFGPPARSAAGRPGVAVLTPLNRGESDRVECCTVLHRGLSTGCTMV